MRIVVAIAAVFGALWSYGQCDVLVWSDEFDQNQVNPENWTYDLGDGCPSLCGWGNGELQSYTSDANNVFIDNGVLNIRAVYNPGGNPEYTSTRMVTRGLQSFKSGKIEANIKMPSGQGLWPAFWLLPETREYGGWPLSGEIDVTEIAGGSPQTNHGTIHYGSKWPSNQYTGNQVSINESLADDFHTYAVEWDQNEIRWYLDDQLFSVKTKADLGTFPWRFDQEFHILLNLAIGGWFPGFPDATTEFPATMQVDYVRVYHSPELSIVSGEPYAFLNDAMDYHVNETPGATYTWTANGGQIVSGQGTNEVNVQWDTPGEGTITATVSVGECAHDVTKEVLVGDQCGVVISDFEEHFGAHWSSVMGNYNTDPVPTPNDVNPSSQAGRWQREGTGQDFITFTLDGMPDATPVGNGERTIAMKWFCNAPEGTMIELRLQNEAQAGGSTVAGTYMTFQAVTSEPYEWEQLYFSPIGNASTLVDPTDINRMQLRILGGQQLAYTFYFDDITILDQECVVVGVEEEAFANLQVGVANGDLNILNLPPSTVEVFNSQGQLLLSEKTNGNNFSEQVGSERVLLIRISNEYGVKTYKRVNL